MRGAYGPEVSEGHGTGIANTEKADAKKHPALRHV